MEQQVIIPLTITKNHSEQPSSSVNGHPTTQPNGTAKGMPAALGATDSQTASLSDAVQEAVGALEEVEAREGWEETAPEQVLRETACVPPVVPRSHIPQGRPATRSPVLSAEPR